MSYENTATVVGNLTGDPELRFTQSGRGICQFGVASNRRFQKDGEWQTVPTFFSVKAWGDLGENVAASFNKGDRLVAIGRFEEDVWEQDGTTRRKMYLIAAEVAASVRFATVDVERRTRTEQPTTAEPSSRREYEEEPFVRPARAEDFTSDRFVPPASLIDF